MRLVVLCLLVSLLLVSAHKSKLPRTRLIESRPQQGEACALCQFVVSFVEQEVNVDRSQIERKLEELCNLLPSTVRAECQGFVGKYVDLLITYILNNVSPQVACEELRMCAQRSSARDQNLCIDCQTAVFFAKMYLSMNSTLTFIEKEATAICQRLFGTNYKSCLSIANVAINFVVNFVENNDAKIICSQFGLCSSLSLQPKKITRPLDGTQCTICEFVVRVAENELLSAPVQEQLAAWIGQLCQYLPLQYQKECRLSVELALPQLLEMIILNYPDRKSVV